MSQQAPYSFITLAGARAQLFQRLYSSVFWSDAELNLYIIEALQTWQALTSYWRNDFIFQSQSGITWMDLTDTVAMPNTLRPYTITDQQVYQLILLHLLEPTTGPVSLQFTTDDIYGAIQRRRDELLSLTSCTQTRFTIGAVAGRITLPDSVIDVRRLAYLPTQSPLAAVGYGTGRYGFGKYGISAPVGALTPSPAVLWPADSWDELSFNRNYTILPAGTPGTPSTYLMSTQPPLSFDVDTPPSFAGSYELLTVNADAALNPAVPSTFPIPDDWIHVIKWGALADLMSRESNSKDVLRAQYAEQRYRMGLSALSVASALLGMRIGNVALQIDSVRSADSYRTSWQAETPGMPDTILHSGLNLIALAPVPDAPTNPYSLTATVVENAPIPAADGDFLQVGRGDLDALLKYAEHLAMFKAGGSEFTDSISMLKEFLSHAATYNRKLLELAEFASVIYGQSKLEKDFAPVAVPEEEAA